MNEGGEDARTVEGTRAGSLRGRGVCEDDGGNEGGEGVKVGRE